MEDYPNNRKKKLLSIIGVVILVIGLLGVTYSFFNYTKIGLGNSLRVGKISFNTSQSSNTVSLNNVVPIPSSEVLTDENNVAIISIDISGDTEYSEGVEYLLTAVDVNNTVNDEIVPIRIMVAYEEKSGKCIGTSDDSYFVNRGGNTSIYKVLATGTIVENGKLLVGYIKPDTIGIDGALTIYAYVDSDDIIVSDTFNGTTDKVLLTTDEWNSFVGNNSLSFKIKIEANTGVWIREPTNTVTLNVGDGSLNSTEISINEGEEVGKLPTPIPPTGYIFDAWYDENFTTMYTENTVISSDITFYAKYAPDNSVVAIGTTYYSLLQTAFNNVVAGTPTEVRLLKDYTVLSTDKPTTGTNTQRPTILNGTSVIFNGNGHTLTCLNNNALYNRGTLRIISGTIICGYSGKGPIENTGILYIDGGIISNTNDRGAIYNNGGKVYISGGTITSPALDRGTIQNVNSSSSITITGGTILQTNSSCIKGAIDNIANGNLTIGKEDNVYNKTTPVIQGAKYGVNSGKNFSVYDGIIKGGTSAIYGIGTITSYEQNSVQHTETVDEFQELYYILTE